MGINDNANLVVDQVVCIIGKKRGPGPASQPMSRLRIGEARLPWEVCVAGRFRPNRRRLHRDPYRRERYRGLRDTSANRMGRLLCLRPCNRLWSPGIRFFFLSTSALIRLASIENPSPPTSPATMHVGTTSSKTPRRASPTRKRSCRARENTGWSGILSSIPSLQKPTIGKVDLNPPAQILRRSERGSQTHSRLTAFGSSAPGQSKVGRIVCTE